MLAPGESDCDHPLTGHAKRNPLPKCTLSGTMIYDVLPSTA
jgi:hypothetical protein